MHKGARVEELLGVLWAYKTTVRTPTRETPFALTYESKVVILVEVRMPTFHMQHFDPRSNNKRLVEELDLL